ncbi:MAG: STAS domain-containing protein [Spirochaetes bacterium]|nr:STAS domain-containing protein [Spirochaetota bacterium]
MIVINGNYLEGTKIFKITLQGYIDSSSSQEFQKKALEYIDGGIKYIIFDCRELTFISSAGFGVFTLINKKLKTLNGLAVIYNLIKEIKNIFELLGFKRFFNLSDTQEEAVGFVKKYLEESKTGTTNAFPRIIECYNCHQKLRILSAGKYRCIKCESILEVS